MYRIIILTLASSVFLSCERGAFFLAVNDLDTRDQFVFLVEAENTGSYSCYTEAYDSIYVDETGAFTYSSELRSEKHFFVKTTSGMGLIGDLFLGPGDSLVVTRNANDDKFQFDGNAGRKNEFWSKFWSEDMYPGDDTRIKQYYQLAKLAPSEVVEYLNAVHDDQITFYKSYFQADTSSLAGEYARATIDTDWISYYFTYMRYRNYYTYDQWDYTPPDSIPFPFLDQIDLNDTKFHYSNSYRNLISKLIEMHWELGMLDTPDSLKYDNKLATTFQLVDTLYSGINRDIAMMDISQSFPMLIMGNDDLPGFYEKVDSLAADFQRSRSLESYYSCFMDNLEGISNLRPGNPAPGFTLPDSSNIMHSLAELRGKVVYIDIWGTWCGPCIEAIPDHEKLVSSFADDPNVAFLNIALEYDDENIKNWRKFIRERDFSGLHLVAEKQFLNPELKEYKINFAPTYILIDKEGKIVHPRAPQPSHVSDLIESVLEKTPVVLE